MKTRSFLLALLPLVGFLFSACNTAQEAKKETPYVVMLSMDGFRWDYVDRVPTPNLDKVAQRGVKAQSLKPAFPSKTFPNHYTIATGLYPDHHGLVHNTFLDPKSGRKYAIGDPETRGDQYFYGGEPIWMTAEKQGVICGSYFWVGSDVDGLHPTYWKPYDHHFPYDQRIDSVIAWLQKPETIRPHLITWYFPEPDITGHEQGPESKAMDSLLVELDRYVGVFLDKLEQLPIYDQINIILTSDHGMTSMDPEKTIHIQELIPDSLILDFAGSSPTICLDVNDAYIDECVELLAKHPHLQAWRSAEVPERLHYGTNPRTLDIVVTSDNHWGLFMKKPKNKKHLNRGNHGFDNDIKEMHAIFYACGPAFKENTIVPTFENVHIYPLIAEILHIQPEKTDGDLKQVQSMLKKR
ncbi:MAG: alkaline phosphatase family protein [Bacteroidetes bacterium]|nr:MAG: alkaline phosphatase family protein [Bacteroidota bacterium]PIE88718.1 MAG: alkaline phosphatase family protein [Bacteroidota bacterium]